MVMQAVTWLDFSTGHIEAAIVRSCHSVLGRGYLGRGRPDSLGAAEPGTKTAALFLVIVGCHLLLAFSRPLPDSVFHQANSHFFSVPTH